MLPAKNARARTQFSRIRNAFEEDDNFGTARFGNASPNRFATDAWKMFIRASATFKTSNHYSTTFSLCVTSQVPGQPANCPFGKE